MLNAPEIGDNAANIFVSYAESLGYRDGDDDILQIMLADYLYQVERQHFFAVYADIAVGYAGIRVAALGAECTHGAVHRIFGGVFGEYGVVSIEQEEVGAAHVAIDLGL